MSKKDSKLTIERLRQVLRYEPATGNFFWVHRDTHKSKLGKQASIIRSHGYLSVCIDSVYYYTHRLVWMYVNGRMPDVIDHINGNKQDNRIENLRSVDQKTNAENVVKPRKHNKSGLIGAYKAKNKFKSKIKIDGKYVYLGMFETPEDASQAFIDMKRKHHVGCTI